jgi:hypothetical protein
VKSQRDISEIEATLERWKRADADAGERAAQRRAEVLRAKGEPLARDYEFHKKPNDWIHLDWMRPIRFAYRNLPFGIRMALKKRLAR